MATLYGGTESAVRMDTLNISPWLTGTVGSSSPTAMFVNGPGSSYRQFSGNGFTYGPSGLFTGGTVTSIYISNGAGGEPWGITGMSMPVASLNAYVAAGNTAGFLGAVFAGNDTLNGHNFFAFNDYLDGFGGHDKINGGAGNDTLIGGAGNDTLNGQIGDDVLKGGSGVDNLLGGKGNDVFYIESAADLVVELAGEGNDWVIAPIGVDLTALGAGQVENAWLTGAANLNATGNNAANFLLGNSGANKIAGGLGSDTIYGADGNDTLDGGSGVDTMYGGNGDDIYYADSSLDTIDEIGGSGVDTVIASLDFSLGDTTGDVENLTLVAGTDDLDGWGNGLANKITGNDGENNISGYDGNDTINGGGAPDNLNGGLGNDSLNGGLGDDSLDGGHGTNTINVLNGNDTVRHQPSIDAYDIIQNFDGNPVGGQDVLDLDSMFDALGVAVGSRAGRVSVTDKGASVDVRIDTNGDGAFDYLAATIVSPNTITVGEDVLVGS